jgi:hypothetical protein
MRVQIAGPEYNRPWGVEFVLPMVGHVNALAPCPDVPSPTVPEPSSDDDFKIGDKVIIIKQGDGDGCNGGPPVGATGTLADGTAYANSCGEYKFVPDDKSKSSWLLTVAHIAHLVPDPTHPGQYVQVKPGQYAQAKPNTDDVPF